MFVDVLLNLKFEHKIFKTTIQKKEKTKVYIRFQIDLGFLRTF